MENKKAVVAGATGLVGRELVEILLTDQTYRQVIVLVRNKMDLEHPKLEQLLINYEQLDQIALDIIKDSVIFCTLGTTMKKAKTKEIFTRVDYEYPMILANLANRYDAEQMLIVTAMGANSNSVFFYNQVKGQVEVGLENLGLRSLSIFRPSLLLGYRSEYRMGERFAARLASAFSFIFKGKLAKYKPIHARTVALAMVREAAHDESGLKIITNDTMVNN